MNFFKSMNISSSGLTAQRMRMDIIAENIANINTTRTSTGDPYRRKVAVFESNDSTSFSQMLKEAGNGVSVGNIVQDETPFKLVHDPSHPDADANGYVRMPNVDVAQELIDMISASRSYEANVTVLNSFKNIAFKAMEIGK